MQPHMTFKLTPFFTGYGPVPTRDASGTRWTGPHERNAPHLESNKKAASGETALTWLGSDYRPEVWQVSF
jgi:hypothetical protein